MAELNEEINNSENSNNIVKNDDRLDICRCPECYLVPSIRMYEEENKLKLNFKCVNNHEYNEDFNVLYEKSKIDIENIKCKV